MGVYKLSANSVKNGRTIYGSMLAGNTAYVELGDFQSIATVSVGAGGSSSVTFSSIPSTYTHLQIRYIAQTNRATVGRDAVGLRMNGDSALNYSTHYISGDGSSVVAGGDAPADAIRAGGAGTSTAGSAFFGAGVVDILDYLNTNKHKTTRALGGVDVNGTVGGAGGEAVMQSGSWRNTNAITSLTLIPWAASSFSQNSTFALYGIKVVA